MAYSNAILYVDIINDSDTAKTVLASCDMVNNSGVVRVIK